MADAVEARLTAHVETAYALSVSDAVWKALASRPQLTTDGSLFNPNCIDDDCCFGTLEILRSDQSP